MIPAEGGTPRVVFPNVLVASPAWSKDGQTIYYKTPVDADRRSSYWSVPAQGGKPTLLVRFDDPERQSPRNESFTDGNNFFFTISERDADVWLLTLSRGAGN